MKLSNYINRHEFFAMKNIRNGGRVCVSFTHIIHNSIKLLSILETVLLFDDDADSMQKIKTAAPHF